MSKQDDEIVGLLGCGSCIVAAASILAFAFWSDTWNFRRNHLRIEQLRQDIESLDPLSANVVVGKAVASNQWLAERRMWNTVPLVSWTIDDRWDEVEFIRMPGNKGKE